jgi:hypothetical protein
MVLFLIDSLELLEQIVLALDFEELLDLGVVELHNVVLLAHIEGLGHVTLYMIHVVFELFLIHALEILVGGPWVMDSHQKRPVIFVFLGKLLLKLGLDPTT